ncbi:uncharacterized mitochondrial protein AtMg00810-like [Rutidosis leptorrhynchoides]|uniref:uncharacterized mitochondrial protein AtMg00810-like n=1 Tax=Rutidosis leptorrhynchoides TaxID=125765 RepID=UPI003A9A1CD9
MFDEFQDVMQKRFKMSSLGAINFFLGLQVDQMKKDIFLHQSKYVADILSRLRMEDERIAKNPLLVNHVITPDNTGEKVNPTLNRAIIGSLMYLTASRPDIMFATFLCARYQVQPNVNHMLAAKKIMRKENSKFGLMFLGSRLVSWQCKKQTAVAQSTCEAKYIAAASCSSQVVWIQQQLRDYGTQQTVEVSPTTIYTLVKDCNVSPQGEFTMLEPLPVSIYLYCLGRNTSLGYSGIQRGCFHYERVERDNSVSQTNHRFENISKETTSTP